MDYHIPPNNTVSDRFRSSPAGISIRPAGRNPSSSAQETGPLKLEQVLPDGRNDFNNHQQNYQPLPQNNVRENQQLHQNIIPQNQRPLHQNNVQQQQNLRFQSNDSAKSPADPSYNSFSQSDTVKNNQKGPRPPFEEQRIQMAPHIKAPSSQRLISSINNSNSGIPPNHQNQINYIRMEAAKMQNDKVQLNLQNYSENYNTQLPKNPSVNLIEKSLDPVINSSSMLSINQKANEAAIKSQIDVQPSNTFNSARTESKPNLLNNQTPLLSAVETKTEPNVGIILPAKSNKTKKTESEESENLNRTDTKTIEKSQKESKDNKIKDNRMTSGVVQKNIKFFEENDTAKKPLTPITITTKKKKEITNVSHDVIKSETHKDQYESGIDETPVIHLNLGSIFQVPRKVAKIPNLKSKKRLQKVKSLKQPNEEILNKKQHKSALLNELLKPSVFCLPHKIISKTNRKMKIYGSKEELLAFFENTKSWRKLNGQGAEVNQNRMKDKVVYKPATNGDIFTPKKIPSKLKTPSKKNPLSSPTKTLLKSPSTPGTPGTNSLPKTPESPAPETPLIKKVPMNKIQVGAAPSPNLKVVRSKVGSLANSAHKPGGGNVKIESHKIDLSKVQPKTEAKNDQYKPSGGDKKIQQVKLQWKAESKVGSLENATYKPGGGDKKIESVKLDFKEKAKSKVGSKDNVKHVPGGGNIKIEKQKLEFKAQSKIGSLDNVKHKPGGGDIKIFDDKTYLRQVSGNNSEGRASGTQAYKAFSLVREVKGKSTPGTPGLNTSIKIKEITAIDNSEQLPKVKKITEVIVTSVASKEKEKKENLPPRAEVTYSKISSSKHVEPENRVQLVKIPAKNHAPVLEPNLNKKSLSDDPESGKQDNGSEIKNDFKNSSSAPAITRNSKQISESHNLSKNKLFLKENTEISEFLQVENIKEMWGEKNSFDSKSNLLSKQQKEVSQISSEDYTFGNNYQQFMSQNSDVKIFSPANLK